MMVTYAIAICIAAVWIIQMIREREIRIAKTPLDIPIIFFFLSQLISSLLSIDPHVSWMGYYSRFNGGMWSVVTYIILYYAFVTNVTAQSIPRYIRVIIGSAVVVSLYAILERLGIDKHLWVQDVQNRVFSTLGQPNWLAAFIVAVIPMTMLFSLKSKILHPTSKTLWKFEIPIRIEFWVWSCVSILFFLVLLFTRSRSGLFGFVIADIALWALLLLKKYKIREILHHALFLHAVFALIVFFNGSNISTIDRFFTFNGLKQIIVERQTPKQEAATAGGYVAPALETGGTESGTIRKYVWQAAVTAWKSTTKTLLVGTGTETFAFTFYKFRPAGHNLTSEWDFLYNKAHNEYLNFLATTGLLGLGSYILMLGVCIGWFIRSVHRKEEITVNNEPITINSAIFAGWLSILATNFFGFSVVIMQLFLYLFPAMMFLPSITERKKKFPNIHQTLAVTATAGIAIVGLGIIFSQWYADTLYAMSYRLSRSGQYAQAQIYIEKAANINPGEPLYKDEMSTTLVALAMGAFSEQNATVGGELANQALTENDRAITISPQNVNFWKSRTKIYYSLSTYDPKLNDAAIAALEHARELSPNDPKIYYNLAILYGRQSENNRAVEFLQTARSLKPDYRDVYYALYIFYGEMKKPADAKAILEEYLNTVDPNDTQLNELLGKVKK
jgi:putative inorganic carbon (HCO3(-)) transporter